MVQKQKETPEQCLCPEIAEELAIKVAVHHALAQKTHAYPDFTITLYPFVSSIISGTITYGDEIRVPGDGPTIQSAIDLAEEGEKILLADGIYTGEGNFNIRFLGKAITVASVKGPENCIIDCERKGRWVLFEEGETRASVLKLGYQVFMEGPIKSPQWLPVRNIENQRRSDFFPARRCDNQAV